MHSYVRRCDVAFGAAMKLLEYQATRRIAETGIESMLATWTTDPGANA